MSKRQTYAVTDLHFTFMLHGAGIIVPNTISQEILLKTNEGNNQSH